MDTFNSAHDEDLWHVEVGGGDVRVVTLEQLDEAFQGGLVTVHTRVWQEGMGGAVSLGELLGLDEDGASEDESSSLAEPEEHAEQESVYGASTERAWDSDAREEPEENRWSAEEEPEEAVADEEETTAEYYEEAPAPKPRTQPIRQDTLIGLSADGYEPPATTRSAPAPMSSALPTKTSAPMLMNAPPVFVSPQEARTAPPVESLSSRQVPPAPVLQPAGGAWPPASRPPMQPAQTYPQHASYPPVHSAPASFRGAPGASYPPPASAWPQAVPARGYAPQSQPQPSRPPVQRRPEPVASETGWPPVVAATAAPPRSSVPVPSTALPSVAPYAMDVGGDFNPYQSSGGGLKKFLVAAVVLAGIGGGGFTLQQKGVLQAGFLQSEPAAAAAQAPAAPYVPLPQKSHAYDPGSAPIKLGESKPPLEITTRSDSSGSTAAATGTTTTASTTTASSTTTATPSAAGLAGAMKATHPAPPPRHVAAPRSSHHKSSGGSGSDFKMNGKEKYDPLNGSL